MSPPLTSNAFVLETRFLSPIPSREVVEVGVDARGAPASVTVLHRLIVVRSGDYTFAVPGPIVDVSRAEGSESEPGLRRGAVLWAGFSPGRRVLAARVELARARAARFLPLRVSIRRIGDEFELRLQNATALRLQTFSANGVPSSVAAASAVTRRAALRREPLGDAFVTVEGPVRPVTVAISAPLRISGELRSGAARKTVDALLGDGGPLELRVRVPAAGAPKLRLRVRPTPPLRTLERRGGDPRAQLDRLISARLQLARARQYERFLAVPDPNAEATGVFVYRTVAARAPPPPVPTPGKGESSDALLIVALFAGGLLAVGASVVWWAHS